MGKILPILLALIGLGGGVGAGLLLRPEPEVVEITPCGDLGTDVRHAAVPDGEEAIENDAATGDFIKMNNQFVVPVIADGQVSALVVMSLNLEVKAGSTEKFYQREPRLRSEFLDVLFAHSNVGGFDGVFTDSAKLSSLRKALKEVAVRTMGNSVIDVLITDFVRQDI